MAVKEELRAVAPLAPRLLPLERRTGSQNWIKKKLEKNTKIRKLVLLLLEHCAFQQTDADRQTEEEVANVTTRTAKSRKCNRCTLKLRWCRMTLLTLSRSVTKR